MPRFMVSLRPARTTNYILTSTTSALPLVVPPLQTVMESGNVSDGVVAQGEAQAQQIWNCREQISIGLSTAGFGYKVAHLSYHLAHMWPLYYYRNAAWRYICADYGFSSILCIMPSSYSLLCRRTTGRCRGTSFRICSYSPPPLPPSTSTHSLALAALRMLVIHTHQKVCTYFTSPPFCAVRCIAAGGQVPGAGVHNGEACGRCQRQCGRDRGNMCVLLLKGVCGWDVEGMWAMCACADVGAAALVSPVLPAWSLQRWATATWETATCT